jgi:hypothetical protein
MPPELGSVPAALWHLRGPYQVSHMECTILNKPSMYLSIVMTTARIKRGLENVGATLTPYWPL